VRRLMLDMCGDLPRGLGAGYPRRGIAIVRRSRADPRRTLTVACRVNRPRQAPTDPVSSAATGSVAGSAVEAGRRHRFLALKVCSASVIALDGAVAGRAGDC
jgi:hypothetical protein